MNVANFEQTIRSLLIVFPFLTCSPFIFCFYFNFFELSKFCSTQPSRILTPTLRSKKKKKEIMSRELRLESWTLIFYFWKMRSASKCALNSCYIFIFVSVNCRFSLIPFLCCCSIYFLFLLYFLSSSIIYFI